MSLTPLDKSSFKCVMLGTFFKSNLLFTLKIVKCQQHVHLLYSSCKAYHFVKATREKVVLVSSCTALHCLLTFLLNQLPSINHLLLFYYENCHSELNFIFFLMLSRYPYFLQVIPSIFFFKAICPKFEVKKLVIFYI